MNKENREALEAKRAELDRLENVLGWSYADFVRKLVELERKDAMWKMVERPL